MSVDALEGVAPNVKTSAWTSRLREWRNHPKLEL